MTPTATTSRPSPTARAHPLRVSVGLLAAALAAWLVTVGRMRGMDAGPGTDLGGLGWFLGIWVTMTAAMMLPSAAPVVLTYARAATEARAPLFVAGYLVAWTVYGLAAYGLYRGVAAAAPGWLAWGRAGPYVAGAAIAAAGLYQLTPLKAACLKHCRSPASFLAAHWRKGPYGAWHMGFVHGLYCLGCCAVLMGLLFVGGVMNLIWIAGLTAVVAIEKLAPFGAIAAKVMALMLVAGGAALLLAG
jgi:predicted metal-binding membrane protein